MEKSRFFNSLNGDRKYLAEDFAAYFAALLSNGVFLHQTNALKVSAYSGLKIKIAAGQAYINGYSYENTADLQKTLTAVTGSRIDRVVVRLDLTTRTISIAVKSGTPATTPVAPALTRTADVYELGLADIMLTAGTTTVTSAMITDLRTNSTYCGGVTMRVDRDEFLGDITRTFAEFTQASSRSNINTNETMDVILGKIKKYFADLGTLAFLSTVNTSNLAASAVTNAKLGSGAVTDAKVADNAAIAQNKINGLVAALAAKLEASGNYPDLTAGTATKAIGDENGLNIAANYALKSELVKKVTGSGSLKVGLNNGRIDIGDAPEGRTTQDIIGVGFYTGGYHIATVNGGAQNGSGEFDCIGMRCLGAITLAGARIKIYCNSGKVQFECNELHKVDISTSGNITATNYDGQTQSFSGITVFFK